MSFCLGINLNDGFIGIADTLITSGNQTTYAKKVFIINRKKHSFFIMTSGLRSVRDKALTYFNEIIERNDEKFDKLYQAVNEFAIQVKRVASEDKDSLNQSGLNFDLHAIVGGQLQNDKSHKIYLLYPQGNWVEVSESSPFVIIGNDGYGKPILNRVIDFNSSLKFALKAGFLSFEATRISCNNVDYPIDIIYYLKGSYKIIEHRYTKDELEKNSKIWNDILCQSIDKLPDNWLDELFPTAVKK